MNLIVNPLASVEKFEGSDDLISGGPVPGRGMKFLHISPGRLPRIHELFTELHALGLSTLDVTNDLQDTERALLEEHGILVDPDNVPERPLFSCMLDDIDVRPKTPASMIVNPTMRFEPFDLTTFRARMEKYLSPHHATVWINDPRTGARWGYWLTPEQGAFVGALDPGAMTWPDAEPQLISKLFAADVLLDANDSSRHSGLESAHASFVRDRYVIVDDIVPSAQLRALQTYYRRYVERGFMKFGDDQVDRRFAAHGEHVASLMHDALLPVMRTITGVPVKRTYAYSAVYAEGAKLDPHVDRDACEFSFSFQLEYLPEQSDGVSPWPLYISVNEPEDLDVDPERDRAVHLKNGGFLAYKGRELVHYRTPLQPGHRSSSIFFHYVPA
jgi:hypothetical protein